jgi:hypothetical protein
MKCTWLPSHHPHVCAKIVHAPRFLVNPRNAQHILPAISPSPDATLQPRHRHRPDPHTLPLQRLTAAVPSSLPPYLLWECEATPGRSGKAGRVPRAAVWRSTWSRGEAGGGAGSRHGEREFVQQPARLLEGKPAAIPLAVGEAGALAGGEAGGQDERPQGSSWPAVSECGQEGGVGCGRFSNGENYRGEPDHPFPFSDVRSKRQFVARPIARHILKNNYDRAK